MIANEKRYFKTQACREILSAVLSFPYDIRMIKVIQHLLKRYYPRGQKKAPTELSNLLF